MKYQKMYKINVFLPTILFCLLTLAGSAFSQAATKPKASPTPAKKSDDYFGKVSDLDSLVKDVHARDADRTAAKDLFDKGDYTGAIQLLTKLIDSSFLDTEDMELRSRAYYKKADYKKALSDIQLSMANGDNGTARQLTTRGDIYRKTHEPAKAMSDYDRAIKKDSKFSPAYDSRGYLHALRAEYDEALKDCTKAISLDKKNVSAYNHRGYAYAKKYRIAEARIDLKTALELDPKCGIASYNLTILLSYDGESDDDDDDGIGVLNDEEYEKRSSHVYYV